MIVRSCNEMVDLHASPNTHGHLFLIEGEDVHELVVEDADCDYIGPSLVVNLGVWLLGTGEVGGAVEFPVRRSRQVSSRGLGWRFRV